MKLRCLLIASFLLSLPGSFAWANDVHSPNGIDSNQVPGVPPSRQPQTPRPSRPNRQPSQPSRPAPNPTPSWQPLPDIPSPPNSRPDPEPERPTVVIPKLREPTPEEALRQRYACPENGQIDQIWSGNFAAMLRRERREDTVPELRRDLLASTKACFGVAVEERVSLIFDYCAYDQSSCTLRNCVGTALRIAEKNIDSLTLLAPYNRQEEAGWGIELGIPAAYEAFPMATKQGNCIAFDLEREFFLLKAKQAFDSKATHKLLDGLQADANKNKRIGKVTAAKE